MVKAPAIEGGGDLRNLTCESSTFERSDEREVAERFGACHGEGPLNDTSGLREAAIAAEGRCNFGQTFVR